VNLCCVDTWTYFTNDWKTFVSNQLIEVESILVFKHVDDVHFYFQLFGPS
jgi:hypothetical protein